jgi:signal transduction histidine kinase
VTDGAGTIELTRAALALLVAFAGLWLGLGLWAGLKARAAAARAAATVKERSRLAALIDAAPAMAAMLRRDGGLEGPDRLAFALGLDRPPDRLDALAQAFAADARPGLHAAVQRARSSGAAVSLTLPLARGGGVWQVAAAPAPPACGPGLLLWFTDVTEAAAEAEALRARLDRRTAALDALSGLIEAAPFPMWHRGPDLRLAMVNGAYVAAVEAGSAADVVREGIELVEEAAGSPLAEAAEILSTQQSAHRTVPATVSGERRMMHIVEVPLGPGGVAGYAIDVEDQEQARADLERFVRAQRDMLDRLSAGVAQFARDRSLIFFNQPFTRLFPLPGDVLSDRPEFERLIDAMREAGHLPEVRDFPDWKQERQRWFTGGLAADEEDWLLPGGKHLRVVAQPLPDGGLLLIFEDRTEQIQLASARDTLLRVRAATFDNLFEAVGVFASDGRLQMWNNRFRETWQLEEEQLAGHPRIDALTPHIAAKLKRAAHAGLVRELVRSATVERKQRSGRVALIDGREFEFAAVPLPDGNALFTMLDVTDSRKVEAALRERTEALEEADRLKTAFVSNMSYELRTPLTSIGGFAEMLAGGYAGTLPPAAADYVSAILDSVARLSELIDNVLDLTQSDTGGLLLAEDEVDLAEICAAAAEAAAGQAKEKGIDFAVEIAPSVGRVTGDRRRIGQALVNILRNAFLYTDEGGRVLLHADGSAREARIAVSDNGRGIAPADQARVFDRFHRTAEGRAAAAASVGLGLPLARQYVEAHGGTVALVSEPGQGTTVTIALPRTAGQQAQYNA